MLTEYLVVTVLVAVGCVAAIATLGLSLIHLMLFQQAVLLSPVP